MEGDVPSETIEGKENRTSSLKCWKQSQPTIIYAVKLSIKSEDEKRHFQIKKDERIASSSALQDMQK